MNMVETLIERIKEYPRLSAAVSLSLVAHIIFIFYTPPEQLSLFLSPPGADKQEQVSASLNVELTGELTGDQDSRIKGSSQGNAQGGGNKAAGEPGDAGEDNGRFAGADPEKWGDLLDRLEKTAGLLQGYPEIYEDLHADGKVSDAYIYRDRRHEDIVVKEVFPTLQDIDKPFKEILTAAPKTLQHYLERNEVIENYRLWDNGKQPQPDLQVQISTPKGAPSKGPLHFPKPQRSDYFDTALPQGKETQLANFLREFSAYDPNEGDLPIATRELYYDNLQRLAYSFSADPSYLFLDYYLENLNKEDFLNNSLYQASQLVGSKTQTELLFAVQDIYNIQQRAWNYYFNFERTYKQLPADKKTRLRNETLNRVTERYKPMLKAKKIESYNDIVELYTKKRLEILDYIIEKTPQGYRRDDARFERAAVQWTYGNDNNDEASREHAVAAWLALLTQKQPQKGRAPRNDSNDNEHLTTAVLQQLEPFLRTYQQTPPASRPPVQNQIQQRLLLQNQDRLTAKREREERLLWPQKAR